MVKSSLIVALLLACRVASAQDGRAEFESGRALFLKGEYQEALPLLQQAYERSGKRPSATLALGKCRQALGDNEGAIILYREYLAVVPAPADSVKVQGETDALERELHSEPSPEAEPDFLFQGRQELPAEAPLWGETTPPPAEEPALYERPLFWIGAGILAIAAGATVVVLARSDTGDPLGGTQGTVLHYR